MEIFVDVMIHEDFQWVCFLAFVFSPVEWYEGFGYFFFSYNWELRYAQRQLEIISLKD